MPLETPDTIQQTKRCKGSFEVTLARTLNMTHERPLIQRLATALQRGYHRHSSRLSNDGEVPQVLNELDSDAQLFVIPIHRPPPEILMEIFRIVLDINPSPFGVTLVCRRWYHVVGKWVYFSSRLS